MVAGLGNLGVTPDALGPKAAARVLVTRHITAAGGPGADLFRPVTVVQPGVLGQTGVESAEVVGGVAKSVRPAAIIAIDALAARRLDRLGCTVQITDTGIQPGAGIGNHRQELTQETLGMPVIGVGVPTVISAATLIGDAVAELTEEPSSTPAACPIRRPLCHATRHRYHHRPHVGAHRLCHQPRAAKGPFGQGHALLRLLIKGGRRTATGLEKMCWSRHYLVDKTPHRW